MVNNVLAISWKNLFRLYEESIGKILSVVTKINPEDVVKLGRPVIGTVYDENGVTFEYLNSGIVFIVTSSMGRRKILLKLAFVGDSTYPQLSLLEPNEAKDWEMLRAMPLGEVQYRVSEEAYKSAKEILSDLEEA